MRPPSLANRTALWASASASSWARRWALGPACSSCCRSRGQRSLWQRQQLEWTGSHRWVIRSEVLNSSFLYLFLLLIFFTAQIALFENGVAAARFSASTTAKQRTTGFHIDGGRPATAFAGASSPCCCWRWTQQAA